MTKLPALAELFLEAKVICYVRHMSWVARQRRNAFELSGIFNYDLGRMVYGRRRIAVIVRYGRLVATLSAFLPPSMASSARVCICSGMQNWL